MLCMRITIDIDDKQLSAIQAATGLKKKSPAVRNAVDCYLRDLEKKAFIRKVMEGHTNYSLNNYELEAFGEYDAD